MNRSKVILLINLFFYLSLFQALGSGQSVSGKSPVEEKNGKSFLLFPGEAKLIIDKSTWKIRLLNRKEETVFSSKGAFNFYIDGSWVKTTDNLAMPSELVVERDTVLRMSAGQIKFQLSVKRISPHGVNVKIESTDYRIEKSSGTIELSPVEEIYGFGEMWNGHVAQRGQSFKLWNRVSTPDECAYMPYFVSTRNYAFFINYGGLVYFDIGKSNSGEISFETASNGIDLNLVLGESIPTTVNNFFSIFGMPARPPRWAFEPWFWLMANPFNPGDGVSAYPTKIYTRPEGRLNTLKGEHFVATVKKYKEMDIPVSVTWFEPPWQTERTSFIPNKSFYPDLKKLIKELDDLGIKSLAWTVPYTTNLSPNWEEGFINGYLAKKPNEENGKVSGKAEISILGEAVGTSDNYIDFYNPQASAWWQKQIEGALSLGLKGFKLDDGQNLALESLLFGNRMGADYHNSYGLEYNKAFFYALSKKYGDDFLMVPRSAWIGSSSFTNFKWPGDLTGTFSNSGLPYALTSVLSLSMCGFPFLSTDIGGYVDQPSPERVWVRWAQFGAFLPGMQTLHMPWWYSPEAQAHYRYLSWLHTELVPLWNTLAKVSQLSAAPITKPLVWDFQDDINTWRIDDEFTIGNAFLVAPVLDVKEHKEYYLPEGRWFYFWNDSIVREGKQTYTWSTWKEGIYKFPLYIKEGAIIPFQVVNDYTGFGTVESKGYLTIVIYPKKEGISSFELDDTGEKVRFEVNRNGNELFVDWNNPGKDFLFRIHCETGMSPSKILLKEGNFLTQIGNKVDFIKSNADSWYFDELTKKVVVRVKSQNTNMIRLIY